MTMSSSWIEDEMSPCRRSVNPTLLRLGNLIRLGNPSSVAHVHAIALEVAGELVSRERELSWGHDGHDALREVAMALVWVIWSRRTSGLDVSAL
jgi:ABC-type glucose/galactose transport system permease subunit